MVVHVAPEYAGYGIFSGTKITWAKLKFTPERARWVSTEQWHPEQRAAFYTAGNYCLEASYSDDRKILTDNLKHGTEVEVLAPKTLKKRIQKSLKLTLAQYQG